MASDDEKKQDEVVAIELPAPAGWTKKFTPKKGGIRRRNDIVFIAPTGDEITNKRQLERYLKSHTDGPPATAFDWGLGDSPRRSARLGVKSKASELSESESPKKRPKKSRLVKESKAKNVSDEDEEVDDDKDAAAEEEEATDGAECAMLEEDDGEEVIREEAVPKHSDIDAEKKMEQVESEEPVAAEIQNSTNSENADAKAAISEDAKKTEQEEVAEELLAPEIHSSRNSENADAKAEVSEDAKTIEQEGVAEESQVSQIHNGTNSENADANAAAPEDVKKTEQEKVAEELLVSEIQNSTNTENADAKSAVSEDAKKIEQEEVAEESLVSHIQNSSNSENAGAKIAVSEDAKKTKQEEVAEELLVFEIQNSANTVNTDANISEMVGTRNEELKHATSENTVAKDGYTESMVLTSADKILCEEKEYPDGENLEEKQAVEKTNGSEGEPALGNSTKTI